MTADFSKFAEKLRSELQGKATLTKVFTEPTRGALIIFMGDGELAKITVFQRVGDATCRYWAKVLTKEVVDAHFRKFEVSCDQEDELGYANLAEIVAEGIKDDTLELVSSVGASEQPLLSVKITYNSERLWNPIAFFELDLLNDNIHVGVYDMMSAFQSGAIVPPQPLSTTADFKAQKKQKRAS